jgi:protein subunit release factor A
MSKSKYKWEPWPPQPTAGMLTGNMPTGVKVTDTETGHFHCCDIFRSQHQNLESAIDTLKAVDSAAHELSREA